MEPLGSVQCIAIVVDDLIDRVIVDARLNANSVVDEAHHRVSPAGFKLDMFAVPQPGEWSIE